MKLTVWTSAYRPFMMGGNVNAPIATEVEVGDSFELGHGIRAHLVVSPSGKTHVAEATTGAFVGTDIDEVKADVSAADPKVMEDQLDWAKKEFEKADHISNERFWAMFN